MEFGEGFFKKILDNINEGVYFVDPSRTITYWNSAAERITGFSSGEVMGSSCANDILAHVDDDGNHLCKNLCPLAETLHDGRKRDGEVYLHHKLGHRVPVRVNISPITDGGGRIIGAVETFMDNSARLIEKQLLDSFKKEASFDTLTELPNRRHIEMRIHACMEEFRRHGIPFGIIFSDIDYFKKINDTHGHKVGDDVLKMVAQTLSGNLRGHDTAGRWGGEEFVLVVSHISGNNLAKLANKLRMLVEKSFIKIEDRKISVTVTMGVVSARRDDNDETLISRADMLLYKGKASGRNCVIYDLSGGIMPAR